MDGDDWLGLIIAIVGLLTAGFASAAESSLGTITKARVQRLVDEGLTRPQAVESLLEKPNPNLPGIFVMKTLGVAVASGFTTMLALSLFPRDYLRILVVALVFAFLLLFSLTVPRTVATRHPDRVSDLLARPTRALTVPLAPLVRLVAAGTNAMLGPSKEVWASATALEEGMWMRVNSRDEEGVIKRDERAMIQGIFEMGTITVREIMVPRLDIVALSADSSVADAIDAINRHGYSRLPVYEENIDNIIGILYAKDLFRHLKGGDGAATVRHIMRPANFVPESKKTDELLRELQHNRVHIAIVVDEYGGVAGLVTIEDLLEEIVGEIRDEYDREEAKIQPGQEGEAVFDATMSIHDVNDTLGLSLEAEDIDTIGGLVYQRLGRVPAVGDQVTTEDAVITVVSTLGRRIRKVRVRKEPPARLPVRRGGGGPAASDVPAPPDG